MAPKTLDFRCAVITGGAGGLGRAMAEYLISQGKQVIIAGRTESKLRTSAIELGHNTDYYVLDTGDTKAIPDFIQKVVREHPEVDCLINNAGVQNPLDINDFSLEKADQEIAINIVGPMHLTVGFLQHLKSKPMATIMNVSSVLGYIPFSIINPVYNGTKAWMHFWSMNLRTQLTTGGANIKIVEIVPPTVATDLHRERSNPDDNKKENNPDALSVEEFMHVVAEGWKDDKDTIGVGSSVPIVEKWYSQYEEEYIKAENGYKRP